MGFRKLVQAVAKDIEQIPADDLIEIQGTLEIALRNIGREPEGSPLWRLVEAAVAEHERQAEDGPYSISIWDNILAEVVDDGEEA